MARVTWSGGVGSVLLVLTRGQRWLGLGLFISHVQAVLAR